MGRPDDPRTVRIESGADSWLAEIREFVRAVIDVDVDTAMAYLIAVSEIATNAESAGMRIGSSEPAVVIIDADARLVTVADSGGGFDPDEYTRLPGPDTVTGRGLYLARAFCPTLTWERTLGGMICTLPFP